MKKFIKHALITLSALVISLSSFAVLGCNNNQEEQGKQETFVDYTLNSFVYWVSGQEALYVDVNNMTATDHFNYDAIIQSYGTKVSISENQIEFVNGTVLSYYGKTGYTLEGETVIFSEASISNTFNYTKLSYGVFSFGIQIEMAGITVTCFFDYYSPNTTTAIYQITFDSQGGSSVDNEYATKGETATKPADPTRKNYAFGGWYTDEKCTAEWDFDKNKLYADTTLYAKWTLITWTVSFKKDPDSSYSYEEIVVTQGEKVTAPTNPTYTGYTFKGWFTDTQLTKAYDFSKPVMSDLTLYAKITPNMYTITFDANGGECNVTAMRVEFDSLLTLPTPTRAGYKFDGWYYYDEYYGYSIELYGYYDIAKSVEVYARWK